MFKEWLDKNPIKRSDFSGEIFPKAENREFWESKYDEKYVKDAERYIGCDWPIIRATTYLEYYTSGNRLINETPHLERRKSLISLLIGEIMEYKGRFLPDIVDGIFAICEESFWGVSAHKKGYRHKTDVLPDVKNHYIDLFASESAEIISMVYYLLYDELKDYCPQILDRMEYELKTRIIDSFSSHMDFVWMGYNKPRVNNWNPWILSNILTVYLILPMSDRAFEDGVSKIFVEADAYYKCMPDDGGCDEGPSYWAVAGGKLGELCELIYTASNGKINFFTDRKIQDIGKFIYRAYIGNGYFANFGDGPAKITSSFKSVAYIYGKRIGDKRFAAFLKDLIETDDDKGFAARGVKVKRFLYNIIYDKEIETEISCPPESADDRVLLPILQTAYIRNGDWYFAAKGGSNHEYHNHNDVGSFIAYYQNKPVLADPGCGTYTRQTFSKERYNIWTMRSDWHNLPVINGCLQTHQYDSEYHNQHADLFECGKKTVRIGYADMYPERAGVSDIKREIAMADDGVDICDSFVFTSDSNNISEHFITVCDVKKQGDRVLISDKFLLECDTPCEIVLDDVNFEGDDKLIDPWGAEKMNRIKFIFNCGTEKTIHFYLRRI